MPERRVNDAQVERLLHALKTDISYRQELAARIAKKDGIKYASAMRRLQRYITEAGEKRAFAHAPKVKQREVRQDYRQYESIKQQQQVIPQQVIKRERLRVEREYDDDEGYEDEGGAYDTADVHLNDLRAVLSYHDGNIHETAKVLGLTKRGERLLDFQVRSDLADTKADVLRMEGGGLIQDAIRQLWNSLTVDTAQELQDFADLFFNRSDWEIGIILEDLRSGATTFADWMDAWANDGFNPDATNSEYWRVWREAYKRAVA